MSSKRTPVTSVHKFLCDQLSCLQTFQRASVFSLVFSFLSFNQACTTAKPPAVASPQAERCDCGPMLGEPEQCGLWVESESSVQPRVLAVKPSPNSSCQAADCGRLFQGICQRLVYNKSALQQPSTPLKGPCYCDVRIIRKAGANLQVCAAWHPDATYLLEYYDLADCKITSCKTEPFQFAPTICPDGFRPFYESGDS